jgi:hypothetical protein
MRFFPSNVTARTLYKSESRSMKHIIGNKIMSESEYEAWRTPQPSFPLPRNDREVLAYTRLMDYRWSISHFGEVEDGNLVLRYSAYFQSKTTNAMSEEEYSACEAFYKGELTHSKLIEIVYKNSVSKDEYEAYLKNREVCFKNGLVVLGVIAFIVVLLGIIFGN